MRLRSSRALVALLVAFAAGACAAQGSGNVGGSGLGDDTDASIGSHGDGGGGPSPDAVIFGIDATSGDDVGDEQTDPPDVADDSHASKSCTGLPDGTPCGAAPDICHDAPVCSGGACAAAAAKADGFVCATAPDDCHTDGTCKAGVCGAVGTRADGYNWTAGDDTARCCGGKAIHTDVDSDCGACGIQCNASNGESCQVLGGEWFCRGCIASADCWSKCCSTSFTPYSCAASDCEGDCSDTYCPAGTHCVVGGTTSSDYCSY
jgi:hypothetical protein